jgi:predicted transcriptional regulator
MPAASAPIKVDIDTDRLISHAAHFLGKAKKEIVDDAVREYVATHRDEINEGVREAMRHLDGTPARAIALLTDTAPERLADYGGLPADK